MTIYILGLNCAYHESATCLLKNGKIIAAAEEERFNRIKHAKKTSVDTADELPLNAMSWCLKKAGIGLKQINYIGYSLDPEQRLTQNTEHQHPYEVTPEDFGTKAGEQVFYNKNLNVKEKLNKLGFKGKFYYLSHHDCHAASTFFVSPYSEAAVLVMDGIGEFEATTIYSGNNNILKRIHEINYPNSIGFLWEKLSKFLGFTEYDAGKVMGLSAYGSPKKYRPAFKRLIIGGNYHKLNDKLIKFRNQDYSELEKLFGLKKRNKPIAKINKQTRAYADIAAILQEVTEKTLFNLGGKIRKKGYKNLCFAGGVALNCAANGKLIQKHMFENIFIQPAAHDAGTAIGAAYYIWNQILRKSRNYVFETPYLGPKYSKTIIKHILKQNGIKFNYYKNIEEATAKLIAQGKIVAWFQGQMEIGPRALGNRSILADPRKKQMITELNYKVKHREPFRPFCPSVLEEKANQWFGMGKNIPQPANYMLATVNVLADKTELIPAVVHIDGTSRIQTVSKKQNPKYYKLIKAFEKETGIPIVLNTSFNNSEPIVCTPEHAINTFFKTKIDYLAMDNFLISKTENKHWKKVGRIN